MPVQTESQKKRRRKMYTAFLYRGPWAEKLKNRPQDKKEPADERK